VSMGVNRALEEVMVNFVAGFNNTDCLLGRSNRLDGDPDVLWSGQHKWEHSRQAPSIDVICLLLEAGPEMVQGQARRKHVKALLVMRHMRQFPAESLRHPRFGNVIRTHPERVTKRPTMNGGSQRGSKKDWVVFVFQERDDFLRLLHSEPRSLQSASPRDARAFLRV
jgi:hypothetical protein